MKKLLLIPGVTALALLCSPPVQGQSVVRETTTTTTTSAPLEVTGTVTEWAPDTVILREKDATAPRRFSFGRKVVYVDAAGNPVARELIAPGVPVTIRYIREGDRMLVDRVIVQRPLAPAPGTVTTTTTTVTGREAHEMEKLRGKIAHEERELADHPDRTHLQDEIARDRAALENIERTQ